MHVGYSCQTNNKLKPKRYFLYLFKSQWNKITTFDLNILYSKQRWLNLDGVYNYKNLHSVLLTEVTSLHSSSVLNIGLSCALNQLYGINVQQFVVY